MGNFTGLNDQEWAVVEPLIPYRWGITQSGTQPLHPRKILNTLIWILTTGARWCDVPVGEQWASRAWHFALLDTRTGQVGFMWINQGTGYARSQAA